MDIVLCLMIVGIFAVMIGTYVLASQREQT